MSDYTSTNAVTGVITVTTPIKQTKTENPVRLNEQDGVLVAEWPEFIVRFLFSDGTTLDVKTHRDDSDLRSAILAYAKKERIEGSARIPLPVDKPVESVDGEPRKRTVRRK